MKSYKKFVKVVVLILILFMLGLVISNNAFAWDMNIASFENGNAGRAGNTVTNVIGAVINLASTVGAGIAIIMLIVIGVKYTSSGAAGKADAKKELTGYVTGAVILFGVSGILKLLQLFIDGNLNNI